MTFLPIVSRELRLASRRRATYWLRSGAAMIMVLVGAWLFLILRSESPKQLAVALFCLLTGGAVLFALLSGPRSTADSISEEKREGTLGLLFLTDLKGYDVVLGKMVAGSLNAFYSIVAVLPLMAIPLLLGGGLTLGEFGRMALVIVDALIFSLTLGICVSSMSRSAQKAAAFSSLLVLFFTAALPALGGLITIATKASIVNPLFLAPSVGFSYYLAFDAPFKAAKAWFWISLAVTHGASWVCLILASLAAPRSWQDKAKGGGSPSWHERIRSWHYGSAASRSAFRQRLLEINPVLWLIARIRSKSTVVWLFLAVLGCAWGACWGKFRSEWLNEGVYVTTAVLVNLVLRYWLVVEATRTLSDHRKSGALELLLSTPLPVEEILRGQGLALRRQFAGPVIGVLALELLFMFATAHEAVADEERLFWFTLWIAGMSMLVADLVALYWVGMWQGLTAKNPLRAVGASLLRILAVPWLAYGLVLVIIVLRDIAGSSYRSNPTWKFFLGLWFGLGIGLDIIFGVWARVKLLTEFRLAAQQQYGAKSKLLRSWLSSLKPHASGVQPGNWEVPT